MTIEHDILNLTFNVARLQGLLELTMRRCAEAGIQLSQDDVTTANAQALAYVEKLYPDREIAVSQITFGKLDA